MPFLFENLEVYKKAMDFVKQIYNLKKEIPDRTIKDQLSRAALSIPLNIAEGQGRIHSREKKQYYNTAKGSLYECLPLLQVCQNMQHLNDKKYSELYELMNEIGKMLSGLIRSVE